LEQHYRDEERLNGKVLASLMPVAMLGYFGVGLFGVAAIIGGLNVWVGLPWFLSVLIALPVAMVPILGAAVGVAGAIEAWGWDWDWAVLLFFWPTALLILSMSFIGGTEVIATVWQKITGRG